MNSRTVKNLNYEVNTEVIVVIQVNCLCNKIPCLIGGDVSQHKNRECRRLSLTMTLSAMKF